MAVKIRLQRRGKTKQPVYRIVVQDSRVARDGRVIDQCGLYNPVRKPIVLQIDTEKVKLWMSKGAIPSKTVERLLVSAGMLTATVKPVVVAKKATTKTEKKVITETSKQVIEAAILENAEEKPEEINI